MTTIIGVDFSGAARDQDTWLAQGQLDGGNLLLDRVQPIRREDLYQHMLEIAVPAVAAMDFPFGLPEEFLGYIGVGGDFQTIADIWPVVRHTDWQDLQDVATEFVDEFERPRRVIEHHYAEAKSTLHRIRPDMLLMTHRGADLLTRWWDQRNRPPWYVLPLHPAPGRDEEALTLMETMPGAFLRSIDLTYRNYKGAGPNAVQNRQRIADDLAANSGIGLPNLDEWRYAYRATDDCLDAVVAAVCAAAWRNQTVQFLLPQHHEEATSQREGWIYAPVR